MFYETPLIGSAPAAPPQLVGELTPVVVRKDSDAALLAHLAELQQQLAELKSQPLPAQSKPATEAEEWAAALGTPAANQTPVQGGTTSPRAVRPQAGRRYLCLVPHLPAWGKVPQQQADLAALFLEVAKQGESVSEEALFAHLIAGASRFESLRKSRQHPTYLWSYYRSFDKKDNKHGSFIKRGLFRQEG
jgi:hypothetical protein